MNNPIVEFEAPEKSLWTLMLTNPDGHLQKENSEYIHWLVYVYQNSFSIITILK